MPKEVAMMIQYPHTSTTMPAVMRSCGHVHIAGLAFPPFFALVRGRFGFAGVPGGCQRWVAVVVAREVLGRAHDDGFVGQEEAPIEQDLTDDEGGDQVPVGTVGVEVDDVVGEEDEEGHVEHGWEGLEQDGHHGAGAAAAPAVAREEVQAHLLGHDHPNYVSCGISMQWVNAFSGFLFSHHDRACSLRKMPTQIQCRHQELNVLVMDDN